MASSCSGILTHAGTRATPQGKCNRKRKDHALDALVSTIWNALPGIASAAVITVCGLAWRKLKGFRGEHTELVQHLEEYEASKAESEKLRQMQEAQNFALREILGDTPGIIFTSISSVSPPACVQARPRTIPTSSDLFAFLPRYLRFPRNSFTFFPDTRILSASCSTTRRAALRQIFPIWRSSSRTPASLVVSAVFSR